MTAPLTIVEKVLSAHCGAEVRAGETVVCDVDCVLGTDGSGPMAIDYFERMGGTRVTHPERVFFSLDHYAPPTTPQTQAFHDRIRTFAAKQGITVWGVGEGISHQLAAERGIARAGGLLIGADSHTVTAGALNCVAIGVGSSDLAAALLTGQIWLRVPETIRVLLSGVRQPGVAAKDVALALVAELGGDGADYGAIEFIGDALGAFDVNDRMVLANLMVEAGAKAAMFPYDERTVEYVAAHPYVRAPDSEHLPVSPVGGVAADSRATYAREVGLDVGSIGARVAIPHQPDRVVPLDKAAGTSVQMVFVGTCTGGRVSDFHAMRAAFDGAGGRLAPGVQLVLTPASREVLDELTRDGSMAHLVAAGAELTTVGCGACCGTSGVIPADGATVLSTANRNFKGRMGTGSARIYLASPEVCGVAAATGVIPGSVRPSAARDAAATGARAVRDDDTTGARGNP